MNVLQLLGTILYAVSLAAMIARTISGKQEDPKFLLPCLISGIILCSANAGLNLKIAVSLSLLAASVIGAPFIQFKKKGEK